MTTALITTEINAVKLFEENGLDPVLDEIKKKIDAFKPDASTNKGRKEIVSFAHKIARSKTFIDNAGKELVSTIKAKSKLIDAERKRSRDYLDGQKEIVRQPFVDWEIEEEEKMEKVRLEILFNEDHEEAIAENTLFDREKELARKEAEMAQAEADLKAKEESEQAEKEKVENEARIKKEAEENAKLEAEKKIQFERDEKERIERESIEAKEKSERDRIQAEKDIKEAKEQAERDRLAAQQKAKSDQAAAVQKAQDDAAAKVKADKIEADRIAAEKKAIADKKAANKKHQGSINNKIKETLMVSTGLTDKQATKVIIEVAQGRVEFMQINY